LKKVLIVFGTRPEAIKMAPVIKEFQKHLDLYKTLVCSTGQHREMVDQVLSIFEISPDWDLSIMKARQDLTDVTTRILKGMKEILNRSNPDIVLVHGDTTTSFSSALAAFYQQIPVGHIEAGLRTNDIYNPWPEEMNRQINSRLASIHFAPTYLNFQNLVNEGINKSSIHITGNTGIDALFMAVEKINRSSKIKSLIERDLMIKGLPINIIRQWDSASGPRRMILITGHRRENFGKGLIDICEAIRDLALMHPEVDFVYPVHLNPNVQEPVNRVFRLIGNEKLETGSGHQNVFIIKPIDYLQFVYLMNKCFFVLTDSGGIQEEAPSLGKPVLVMREITERIEALAINTIILTGTNKSTIVFEATQLLNGNTQYKSKNEYINPYGDGKAAERIVTAVNQFIN
jgi:UDP-N-acetylglucosamine 2-epimerase (non-hydrolysing)